MAAEGGRIEAETGSALFHDGGDVPRCETPISHALCTLVENPAKDRAFGNAGGVQPSPQRRHGASDLAPRYRHLAAEPLLVRLRPTQRDEHSLRGLFEIVDVERHKFA